MLLHYLLWIQTLIIIIIIIINSRGLFYRGEETINGTKGILFSGSKGMEWATWQY